MASVTDWTPIGDIDASNYTTAEPYAAVHPFTGVFNGQGYAIKNLNCSSDITNGRLSYGLFGSIENATVKNLILGDAGTAVTWTMSGTAPKYSIIAPLACFAKNSVIEGCTNYYNVDFTADNKSGEFVALSGLVGAIINSTIGGESKTQSCANRGFVRTGRISNTANGGTGMQTAGICAFMAKAEGGKLSYCTNYGDIFTEGNGTNRHGPGWLCGYSGASTATWINCKACVCGGYVGDYSKYKDDPTSAPDATNENAFCHANKNYDPSINF